jgi:hypothetical protein
VMFTCGDIKSETRVHKFSRRHLLYSATQFRYAGGHNGVKPIVKLVPRIKKSELQEYDFILGQREG